MPQPSNISFPQHFASLDLFEKLLFIFLALLCFLIPMNKIPVVYVIGCLLFLSTLITLNRKGKNIIKPGPVTLLLIILYLLYVIGMIYTSVWEKGLFDLQIKLSFVMFPAIFMFSSKNLYSKTGIRTLKFIFVSGAIAGTFVSLGHALYISLTTYFTFDHFMYNELSWSFHPSYHAMYLTIAIIILFVHLINQWDEIKTLTKLSIAFIILYFFVFIIFLNSKAGMILAPLSILILLIYLVVSKRKYILGIVALVAVIIVSVFVLNRTPYITSRFVSFFSVISSGQANPSSTGDGTSNRVLAWKCAEHVALENLPMGVGTGDVRATLNPCYLENGFQEGAELKLNAHNQFLQTTVAIGLPGLITLLLIFIIFIVQGIRKRNVYILLFTLVLLGNFLVESMLETQAGVVFITFFICLYDMAERRSDNADVISPT
jgi:O-antigen ligase